MRLIEFVLNEYKRRHYNLSDGALHQLAVSVRVFERQLGRLISTQDLSPELLCELAARLHRAGRSPRTIKGRISNLLTIWREARRRKLAPDLPEAEDLPLVSVPRKAPRAWTISELSRLIAVAARLQGRMRKSQIPANVWWASLLLFLYDTGARLGATLDVTWSEVSLQERYARLKFSSAKTGVEQIIPLTPQTVGWMSRLPQADGLIWPLTMCESTLYADLKAILQMAGLPTDRASMFHRIRKTNATYTAVGGSLAMAQRNLGHTTPEMTLGTYIDPTIYRPESAADVIPRPDLGELPG